MPMSGVAGAEDDSAVILVCLVRQDHRADLDRLASVIPEMRSLARWGQARRRHFGTALISCGSSHGAIQP